MEKDVQLDTYRRFKTNLNIFCQWTEIGHRTMGNGFMPERLSKEVTMPEHIATNLKDAFKGYKDCLKWYTSLQGIGKAEDQKDTAAYDNMLHNQSELKKYLLKLARAMKYFSNPLAESSEPGRENESVLDPMASAATDAGSTESSTIQHNTTQADHSSQIIPTEKTQAAVALYYLLKDCTNIRIFAQRAWQDLISDRITLQTASLVTNAAIAMIRELCDHIQDFPHISGSPRLMHTRLIRFLCEEFCCPGQKTSIFKLGDSKNIASFEDLSVEDAVCSDMNIASYIVLVMGPGNEESDSRELTAQVNKFFRCITQLYGLFTQKNKLPETLPHPWWEDYVYKATSTMLAEGAMDTWVVFAFQMLWDTHCTIASDSEQQGAQILKSTGEQLRRQYQRYLDASSIDRSTLEQTNLDNDVRRRITHIEKIALGKAFQLYVDASEKTFPDIDHSTNDPLLHIHPTLCGITQAEFRQKSHKLAVDTASSQGHILAVAQLYRAIRHFGFLPAWPDMDFLIGRQQADWAFRSTAFSRPEDSFNGICEALGLVASKLEFTPDIHDSKQRKKAREFQKSNFQTKNSKPYRLRYLARSVELSGENIAFGATDADERDVLGMAYATAQDFDAGAKSALQILTAYRDALEHDEIAQSFDVLGLHVRCLELLQNIQHDCVTKAPNDYPADVYVGTEKLNALSAQMVRDLGGCKREGENMLPHAVSMTRTMILERGEEGLAEAKGMVKSKGKGKEKE